MTVLDQYQRPPSSYQDDAPGLQLAARNPRLAAYAERTIAVRRAVVHNFTLDGRDYVIKFARRAHRARYQTWASAALCGALTGRFPDPQQMLPNSILDEAERLQDLYAQGMRVPQVYAASEDYLVLEDCGESVEAVLNTESSERRRMLLWAVAHDLASFHRAGHWHGGAQVRNLTLRDRTIYRIDFEENVGAVLPLPLAQAYDVLLAFNSMVDHLDDDHALGVQLLRHYLEHVDSEDVVQSLKRLRRWLSRLQAFERLLNQRLREKQDLQRTRAFTRILTRALADPVPTVGAWRRHH